MNKPSRKDELISALAVVVLLVGTATGSANVLLVMSLVMLAFLAVAYHRRLGSGVWLVVLVATVTGIIIGVVLTMRSP